MDDAERPPVEMDEKLAARLAQVRKREHIRGLRKREWVVLSLFLVMALGAYANFRRVIVSGRSMEPTFRDGEAVVVWKFAPHDKLKPGDVIVFRHGPDEWIKRIVYIADPRHAGEMPPPDFPRRIWTPRGIVGDPPNDQYFMTFDSYFNKVHVGFAPTPPVNDTIYVMGDNFADSSDSRDFGPIDPGQSLGKVLP